MHPTSPLAPPTAVPAAPVAPTAPVAGWYPDPSGAGRRFWDGTAWTGDVLPMLPQAAPAHAGAFGATNRARPGGSLATMAGRMGKGSGLSISLAGAAAVAVSGFLTWVNFSIEGQHLASANGFAGSAPWRLGGGSAYELATAITTETSSGVSDFFLLLALAVGVIAAAVIVRRGKGTHRHVQFAAGLGALATALTVFEMTGFGAKADELTYLFGYRTTIAAGPGAWLCLAGCLAMTAGAVLHAVRAHAATR